MTRKPDDRKAGSFAPLRLRLRRNEPGSTEPCARASRAASQSSSRPSRLLAGAGLLVITSLIALLWWLALDSTCHQPSASCLVAALDLPDAVETAWWFELPAMEPSAQDSSTIAFQAGVRSVDLELALELGDTSAARQAGIDLIEAGRRSGSPDLALAYLQLLWLQQDETMSQEKTRHQAAELEATLVRHLEPTPFKLGQWAESGRLAALFERRRFFTTRLSRRLLRDLVRTVPDGDARATMEWIQGTQRRTLTRIQLRHLEARLRKLISALSLSSPLSFS